METAGYFERRYSLKPKWVNLINLSSGKSQKAVQASFTKCSCGKAQAIVYVTQSRNPDEATRDLIAKVGHNTNPKLEMTII